jgi:hypothetical protein
MDKMEHIRGQIFQDQDLLLDRIDGYLNCHEHKGKKTFYGYFELLTEQAQQLLPGTCYRMVLSDGRKCSIYTEIVPSNSAGKVVAEFHVTGGFKK